MNDYLATMFSFAQEAGRIAMDLVGRSRPELKSDNSVITEADRRISSLAHSKLSPYLNGGGHLLIDEEDPHRDEHLQAALRGQVPFVWSVDPVDGTRIYANCMPHYGISIGLLKDRCPWMGAVYFPALEELFYCDGQDAFFVQRPFTDAEVKTRIVPFVETISSRSLMIVSDDMPKHFDWRSDDCRLLVLSTAVCEFCWPAIGRGCGSLSRVYLWDLAGSWPIAQKAGLQFFSLANGNVLEGLQESAFDRNCRLKEYHILSSPGNFEVLRGKIINR